MEIFFFKGVPSKSPRLVEFLQTRSGALVYPGDHMCVCAINFLGNGFLKYKGGD